MAYKFMIKGTELKIICETEGDAQELAFIIELGIEKYRENYTATLSKDPQALVDYIKENVYIPG